MLSLFGLLGCFAIGIFFFHPEFKLKKRNPINVPALEGGGILVLGRLAPFRGVSQNPSARRGGRNLKN